MCFVDANAKREHANQPTHTHTRASARLNHVTWNMSIEFKMHLIVCHVMLNIRRIFSFSIASLLSPAESELNWEQPKQKQKL